MRGVQLPRPSPLSREEREAFERLAKRNDEIGELAEMVLQSDRELRTR